MLIENITKKIHIRLICKIKYLVRCIELQLPTRHDEKINIKLTIFLYIFFFYTNNNINI